MIIRRSKLCVAMATVWLKRPKLRSNVLKFCSSSLAKCNVWFVSRKVKNLYFSCCKIIRTQKCTPVLQSVPSYPQILPWCLCIITKRFFVVRTPRSSLLSLEFDKFLRNVLQILSLIRIQFENFSTLPSNLATLTDISSGVLQLLFLSYYLIIQLHCHNIFHFTVINFSFI